MRPFVDCYIENDWWRQSNSGQTTINYSQKTWPAPYSSCLTARMQKPCSDAIITLTERYFHNKPS
jgi:hypothetical protein